MALKSSKSVTLTGTSEIEGQQVVFLTASVTTENAGSSNINQNIQNQDLYRANRVECRKDVEEFQSQVWAIEDQMLEEMKADKK